MVDSEKYQQVIEQVGNTRTNKRQKGYLTVEVLPSLQGRGVTDLIGVTDLVTPPNYFYNQSTFLFIYSCEMVYYYYRR